MRRLLLLLCLPLLFAFHVVRAESVDELVEKCRSARDEVDTNVLYDISSLGTREAAQGLVEVYDLMGSLYMKREVMRALAEFDGVGEAQEPALLKIANVATESEDAELRGWALDTLMECRSLGKHFLTTIVDSSAEDGVREEAMRRHVSQSSTDDHEWYWKLYQPNRGKEAEKKKKRKKKKGDEEAPKAPRRLGILRQLAFEALSRDMEEGDLLAALSDKGYKIRALALGAASDRRIKDAMDLAEERYKRVDEIAEVRAAAARYLKTMEVAKLADRFIDDGTKGVTPRVLRFALADLVGEMADEGLKKKLVKKLGKGKPPEKLFYLRALRGVNDPKMSKGLQKLLGDKNVEVRIAAAGRLAEVGDEDSIKSITKMMGKAKDSLTAVAGMKALGAIRKGDPEWEAELQGYISGEDQTARNAAIKFLAESKDAEDHIEIFLKHVEHPSWSTRLACLDALENLGDKRGVEVAIGRIEIETGVMRRHFSDFLWRQTGQPFGVSLTAWKKWWENEGADFEPIRKTELYNLEKEREERRLRAVTKTPTKFFGIKIESQRVIFIVDVSGSMAELTAGQYAGESGPVRMEVAKRELINAIKSLDAGTLFNIITFSGDVGYWLDEDIAQSDGASRDEAVDYVDRLGALGGTNLYGALEAAFEDADVDSIYLLSDGEPSVGDITDPGTIREHVRLWNENRGVIIHSIAVGGSLQVLEWLAEDTGGDYVKFP